MADIQQATLAAALGSAPPTAEEKKSPLHTAGMTQSLRPSMPDGLSLMLSERQNYALVAEQIFVQALSRTMWAYREHYVIIDAVLLTVRNIPMESLATKMGVDHVTNLVHYNPDPVLREFLHTVQVQFFTQFGQFDNQWEDLIGSLATGLCGGATLSNINTALSLVPEELSGRMFVPAKLKELLLANNWLIMFIFISLWGRTYTYDELRATSKRQFGAGAAGA